MYIFKNVFMTRQGRLWGAKICSIKTCAKNIHMYIYTIQKLKFAIYRFFNFPVKPPFFICFVLYVLYYIYFIYFIYSIYYTLQKQQKTRNQQKQKITKFQQFCKK